MSTIKITRLTAMQVDAIRRYLPEMTTTAQTASYEGDVATLAEAARTALKEHGSTPGAKALHAVIRKLDAAIDPDTGSKPGNLVMEDRKLEAPKPAKRTRKTKAADKVEPPEEFAALLGAALGKAGLTPGALARQLGVESAVVSKYVTGKRTPRPDPKPGSIAARLTAWVTSAS